MPWRGAVVARFILVVLALTSFPLMLQLITILNRCHRFPGFVYQQARFSFDHKSIEIDVRPRKRSAAVCSRCHQPAPGYDQLPERRFEFILTTGGEAWPALSWISWTFVVHLWSGAFWFFCCIRCGGLIAAAVRRSSWRK